MNADARELTNVPANDVGASLALMGTRITSRLKLGLYHHSMRYGLRRDLHILIQRPSAKIPIEVRPMVDSDLNASPQ